MSLFMSALQLIALSARAQSPSGPGTNNLGASHWVALLESRYRSSKTTEATFLERYTESGRLLRVEAGQVYFRRPGKMRWEYASPEKNLFLVDGKTAWFYVPQDHTVTRVPAKRSADWRTPLALLAGEMKVSRVCAHIAIAANEKPVTPGDVVLSCNLRSESKTPPADAVQQKRSDPDIKSQTVSGAASQQPSPESAQDTSVFLEIAPDGNLVRVVVRDKGGITLEFQFANWRFDSVLAESAFEFHPPAGVAILNGELPLQNETVK